MFCHGAVSAPLVCKALQPPCRSAVPDAPSPEEHSSRAHNARPPARAPACAGGGAVPSTVDVMKCHVPLPWRPFLHRVSLPPRSRRPGRARGPCFAHIAYAPARASGRAFRAGAVRAPGCPRASRMQDTLLPSVSSGFFRAGAKAGNRAPRDAASFAPIAAYFPSSQASIQIYFSIPERIVSFGPG